jgi:hypothetical protein
MKNKALLALVAFASAPTFAVAQDARTLWTDAPPTIFQQEDRGPRGRGGQVTEEWYTPNTRASLSFFGRVSFLSDTDVTVDGIWYTDLFDPGWGLSVEADLLTFIAPHWGVGPYVSYNWDRFDGNSITTSSGFSATPDQMTLNSVFVGGKVLQRLSPWVSWEGRMGLGLVTYSHTEWSGFDPTGPETFSNEELFQRITRGAFEIGGRIGVGSPHVQADFGFGVRIMGGASRGRDVTNSVDPDYLTTFMLELGLSLRF